MEGRRAHAVAHLAYARSQKSGTGILGSKRVLQGGEKSSPLVVLCDLWLVYRVYGLGGGKCGLGSKTAPRVNPGPAEAWSSHLKYKKESKQTYERWIYQSRSDCPGQ